MGMVVITDNLILSDYYENLNLLKKAQRLRRKSPKVLLCFAHNLKFNYFHAKSDGWGYSKGMGVGFWHSNFSRDTFPPKGDGMFPYINCDTYGYKK